MSLEEGLNLPKVTKLVSTSPISSSQAFATLIRFLQQDQDDFLWEDIFHIAESMVTSHSEERILQNLRRSSVISVASPEPMRKHWSEQADPVDDDNVESSSSLSSPSGHHDAAKDEPAAIITTEKVHEHQNKRDKKKLKKAAKKASKNAKKEKKAKKKTKRALKSGSIVDRRTVGYRISNHVFSSEDIKHHVRRNHNED